MLAAKNIDNQTPDCLHESAMMARGDSGTLVTTSDHYEQSIKLEFRLSDQAHHDQISTHHLSQQTLSGKCSRHAHSTTKHPRSSRSGGSDAVTKEGATTATPFALQTLALRKLEAKLVD